MTSFGDFFPTRVEQLRLTMRVKQEPTLLEALGRLKRTPADIREYAERQLRDRKEDFVTAQVLGEQGVGKSGASQALAEEWQGIKTDRPFTYRNILGHYDDFLARFPEAQPGDVLILDEQARIHGVGSRRIADDIINLNETCRKAQISFLVVSPTEKILGVEDVHLTIEVVARADNLLLCVYQSRTNSWLGSFILTLDWNNPVWLEYNEKVKDPYILDAKALRFRKNDYELLADKVASLPEYEVGLKKRELELLTQKTLGNLTIAEKDLVVTELQMRGKKKI